MSARQYSHLTKLECSRCGAEYDADLVQNYCACGSPLLARYDLVAASTVLTPEVLARRPETMWRYHDVLPVRDPSSIVSLGEAITPLLHLRRLEDRLDVHRLLLKDESHLPTGTFKARGAAVGVSRARELGITKIAMPTNGNAGSAWAGYSARAGMDCVVLMPATAPSACASESRALGARLGLVNGSLRDAAALSSSLVENAQWFDASTLREPYRIEGKKSIGYEIVEQLGWRVPDVIVCPAGGGVCLIGIWKALSECVEMGLVAGEKLPRLVCVQSDQCAPIVDAWAAGRADSTEWPDPGATVAFGIRVAKALGDFLVLEALYASKGCAVAVADDDLLQAQRQLGESEGVFVCPEGAATLAACHRLRAEGWLSPADEVVLVNTGAGIKYVDAVDLPVPVLEPGDFSAVSALASAPE